MNEVIAEVRLDNIYTATVYISKSPETRNYDEHYDDVGFDLLLEQGFVWYQDAIAFDMLTDYQSYWVKVAVKDRLEIDPVIATEIKNFTQSGGFSVIILPFQVLSGEQIYLFGSNDEDASFSFTLPVGHYQLLFENREFTREEIEAEPIFDCEDIDYDDYDYQIELCLLTFISTEVLIEPRVLAYSHQNPPTPLVLYDQKLYPSSDE